MADIRGDAGQRIAKSGRRRRLAARALLAGFALLLALIVAECAVRILAPQPASWLAVYRRHPTLSTYTIQQNVDESVDTGETRWRCITDADGFRVSASPPAKQAHGSVLCLGDSFTFAHGVDHEESFVGLLDANPSVPFRFINAGMLGYGPVQYLQILRLQLEQGLAPAQVLVAVFLGNDFHDCVWSKDLPVVDGLLLHHKAPVRMFLKQHSHLYRVASKALHGVAQHDAEGSEPERELVDPARWSEGTLATARARFEEAFTGMAETCRDRAIPLHVVLIPMRRTILAASRPESGAPNDNARLPNTVALEILRTLEIHVTDLTDLYAGAPIGEHFFEIDGHLTPSGHRVAADAIAPMLAAPAPPGDTPR